jgi:glycosyltransferase involved in cell wall biosynthesis
LKIPLGDIEGFSGAVRKLWSSKDEIKRMGENARRDYEDKYLPEDNYNQLLSIYQACS